MHIYLIFYLSGDNVAPTSTAASSTSTSTSTSTSCSSHSSEYGMIKNDIDVGSIGVPKISHTLMSDNGILEGCNDYLESATWL